MRTTMAFLEAIADDMCANEALRTLTFGDVESMVDDYELRKWLCLHRTEADQQVWRERAGYCEGGQHADYQAP